ncbi:hypothetical protein B0H14DRAFT_2645841 [Mycena olivaceomarginata]|nr:hypothetical protein B0H14DRAFT_2645841 [Mycena olivaceomarginata]
MLKRMGTIFGLKEPQPISDFYQPQDGGFVDRFHTSTSELGHLQASTAQRRSARPQPRPCTAKKAGPPPANLAFGSPGPLLGVPVITPHCPARGSQHHPFVVSAPIVLSVPVPVQLPSCNCLTRGWSSGGGDFAAA